MCFAVVHKLGRDHAACAKHFAIGFERLIHHSKSVTLAQGAVKVDVARKDVSQLAGHAVGDVGIIRSREQRALNRAVAHAGADVQACRLFALCETVGGALHHPAGEALAIVVGPASGQACEFVFGVTRHADKTACTTDELLARGACIT